MAGEDDEVIVNLSGDLQTTDVVVVEPDAGKKTGTEVSFNDGEDDPLVDLKKQFTQISGQLRTVVADNQQTKQQLQETQQRLQTAEATNQLETIESGIAQIEADIQQAEHAYARAFDAGDGAAMARAQRAMARGETQLAQLGEARDSLRSGAQRQAQPRQSQQRAAPSDPVEAAIVNGRMSHRSAEWLRAHPDCITDPKKNARMLAAHHAAIADGVEVDSEDYFERIEKGIKPVTKSADPQPGDGKKQTGDGRRPSSGAASAAGTGGGMGGNGSATTVKLTAGEARSATDGTLVWNYDDPSGQNKFKKGDPIGLAEMARRKHEGMKAGLYDRNNMEA